MIENNENEDNIKKIQKIPKGPKKKSYKIKNEDIENIKKYYVDLDSFYKNNEDIYNKSINESKFLCNYDKDNKLFYIKEFAHSKFDSFGILKDKILYLSFNEVFYLNQIGLIKIQEEKNLIYDNIDLINLYSYLRRSGKIIKCCDLLWKEKDNNNIKKIYNNYFLVFNDLEKYKRKLVDYIIFQNSSKEINFNVLTNIFKDSEQILNIYENKNQSYKILLALSNKITITFLKINKDPFPSIK